PEFLHTEIYLNCSGCVKNEEGNEDWFDAKENLTVANCSVIGKDTKKQQEEQDTADLREARSGDEYFICVDGLHSSVSEADLRSHFQKYPIRDVLVSVESNNCRCALISFKDISKAKLAVEKMNQKKIKGKEITAKIINTVSGSKYLVSQVLTNKLSPEIQPVEKSQRSDQSNTLASAFNSVEAPITASAAEKITSSKTSCSTHVPSETKCPDWKPPTEGPYLPEVKKKVNNYY
uniref:Uncharacterized protein n=1 Tax=Melopsittacus undulatus TaxID=13146 RepID=A0A8C6J694_MELUD